jgi:hypothetical protein
MERAELSSEQKQIWDLEERYWQFLKTRNRDGCIGLWDESLVGWPYSLPDPIRKDVMRSDPFRLLQGLELKNVQLEPKAVQMFQQVAIVHYMMTATYARKDGSRDVERLRMTHTWLKTNGAWLIIGGMSAPAFISVRASERTSGDRRPEDPAARAPRSGRPSAFP